MVMRMRLIIGFIFIWITSALWVGASAGPAPGGDQVFLTTQAYVAQVFPNTQPKLETLWPTGELREQLTKILGHRPSLRFKYWGANNKTVWVLDEIGKDRPITAAVTIVRGKIEDVQVLVFRESRGWEIKHEFFTRQFNRLWLGPKQQLSARIDNITGATLSVKAMTRMAKAALLLHDHTPQASISVAQAR